MTTINNKYINAVFNFDVDAFKTLLEREPFDLSLLQDIRYALDVPCPIYWITQCWEIIFEHPEEWQEDIRETIAENKQRNLEIKKIFEERFNVVFNPIDFYNTDFWFYRANRDETFEDVLYESRDNMIAKGHRAIDLDLYVAVNKFDFKEVERLLELGANPVYEIPEEVSYCMDRIGTECSLLENELKGIIFYRIPVNAMEEDSNDLIFLIGLAAHESMYSLLSKYDPRNNARELV